MAVVKLTKTLIEGAAKAATDRYLWDAQLTRFGVRITPAGRRIYIVQYQLSRGRGRPPLKRRMTIGWHGDPWTLEMAREEARRLIARIDLGGDPFAELQSAREAGFFQAQASAREAELRRRDRFSCVLDRYEELRLRRLRTGHETARLLRREAVPLWGERHVSEIRRSDVYELIDRLQIRSPAVARSTWAALRGLFRWCLERELIPRSPCEGMTAPPRPADRDRVLEDQELRVIWAAAERMGFPFGPVVQLLLLTGQRRGEVAGMTWKELDLDAGVWRIPRERTKNGHAHEVDLSPQALAIIRRLERSGACLFPARNSGPVRGFSAARRKLDGFIEDVRRDAGQDAEPQTRWRVHDLRRTAATGMAALGHSPHVIERVLNHISGVQGGLVGVYQRHEYRPERRRAVFEWGAHVEGLTDGRHRPSNVVLFRR